MKAEDTNYDTMLCSEMLLHLDRDACGPLWQKHPITQ